MGVVVKTKIIIFCGAAVLVLVLLLTIKNCIGITASGAGGRHFEPSVICADKTTHLEFEHRLWGKDTGPISKRMIDFSLKYQIEHSDQIKTVNCKIEEVEYGYIKLSCEIPNTDAVGRTLRYAECFDFDGMKNELWHNPIRIITCD
jgi:hypothetical protein